MMKEDVKKEYMKKEPMIEEIMEKEKMKKWLEGFSGPNQTAISLIKMSHIDHINYTAVCTRQDDAVLR
ncbi:MAG: hypothetical protein ACREDU_11260 [Methylocella sp.]